MGRDKALLELAGKPLIDRAVTKLRRLCTQVAILSSNEALASYAPLVPDLHPGCGPMGGIEAALAHARFDWSLILPVDVPFLPTAMLDTWVRATLAHAHCDGTRLALFVVDGKPHPALLMIHRDTASYLSAALARGEYKLMPALAEAAGDLAARRALPVDSVFRHWVWDRSSGFSSGACDPAGESWPGTAPLQQADPRLYFTNLNTPEDFAEAERNDAALDT